MDYYTEEAEYFRLKEEFRTAYADGLDTSLERIEQLVAADNKGCVLILPCKVGDTAYELGHAPCHLGNDFPDGMSCAGCEDACDIEAIVVPFEFATVQQIVEMQRSLGSRWFLTEPEAMQALAKKGVPDDKDD